MGLSWMRNRTTIVGVSMALLSLGLSACATGAPPADTASGTASGENAPLLTDLFSRGRVSGAELDARIAKAQEFPLGSRENPVRADMPQGQRAYLSRLRCADGNAPEHRRLGNLGSGVFGSIVDGYRVTCPGSEPASVEIVMDMYHPGHQETAAVAGFDIVSP